MVESFKHKGLKRFFETGSAAGIQSHHAKRLRMLLAALDSARTVEDMDISGFRLHPLKGTGRGRWSVWVNGNAHVLDYEDYH
jgi:proteic killer suppression protein